MYTCTSKKNKFMRQIRKWNNKKSWYSWKLAPLAINNNHSLAQIFRRISVLLLRVVAVPTWVSDCWLLNVHMYTCTSKKNKFMRQIRKWNNKKSMTLYGSLIVYSTNTLEHYCQIVKILIRNLWSIQQYLQTIQKWRRGTRTAFQLLTTSRKVWIEENKRLRIRIFTIWQ
jgi:hypothetical protein